MHPKNPEQLERLKKAIEGNFLFSHLDEEQSAQILGALVEKPIPAKDIKVSESETISVKCPRNLTISRRLFLKETLETSSML